MIVQEPYESEWAEQPLVRTYSDRGMMIRQNETGIEYTEAIDVLNHYTYTETDMTIEEYEKQEKEWHD